MRKASVHRGSGLSEERSATTLPHADPRYASKPTADTHTTADMRRCRSGTCTYAQTVRPNTDCTQI